MDPRDVESMGDKEEDKGQGKEEYGDENTKTSLLFPFKTRVGGTSTALIRAPRVKEDVSIIRIPSLFPA